MHPVISAVRPHRKIRSSSSAKPAVSQEVAILERPRVTRVRSIRNAQPGPGEVRVRLQGCGISPSGLPQWEGHPGFRYPQDPGAPGHEGWGFVDAIGNGVDDIELGQRVVLVSRHAYAQYDIAPRDCVVPLPEELDDEPFPGESFADAMNIFDKSDIRCGQTVAIVGAGFVGLLLTQLAADRGAHVVVLSRRPFALECAEAMDAEETVAVTGDGDAQRALHVTCGKGFDRVIEIAGTQATFNLAKRLCAARARLIIAAHHEWDTKPGEGKSAGGALTLIDAFEHARTHCRAGVLKAIQAALEGRLDPFPLMSHSVSLRSLDAGFRLTRERPEGFVKALLLHDT